MLTKLAKKNKLVKKLRDAVYGPPPKDYTARAGLIGTGLGGPGVGLLSALYQKRRYKLLESAYRKRMARRNMAAGAAAGAAGTAGAAAFLASRGKKKK